jgi:hypothetical protein
MAAQPHQIDSILAEYIKSALERLAEDSDDVTEIQMLVPGGFVEGQITPGPEGDADSYLTLKDARIGGNSVTDARVDLAAVTAWGTVEKREGVGMFFIRP